MTKVISLFGVLGRFAGDLMMSALGWASSLLFGRVPRSHERYLVLMMAASLAWLVVILGLLVPSIAAWGLSSTPHPPFVDHAWLALALLFGAFGLPALVGAAGAMVPSDGERPRGLSILGELLRGYLLTPLISGLLLFLALVGIARKVRSLRNGWSDTHIPIVMARGGYDRTAEDLLEALRAAAFRVQASDAPRVLTVPGWLLTIVAGPNVGRLRPDRLTELRGRDLRVGVYPSDIAISCPKSDLIRVRAALLDAMLTTSAHLTTNSEGQQIEDRLQRLASAGYIPAVASLGALRAALIPVDVDLLDLEIQPDEWDTLRRLRLQVECTLLRRIASAGEGGVPVGEGRRWAPTTALPEAPSSQPNSAGNRVHLQGEPVR